MAGSLPQPSASSYVFWELRRPFQRRLSTPTEHQCHPEPDIPISEALVKPETLSERIKASVTVLEFVSQYVELTPTKSGAIGLCPFHDDHRPSFGVNAEGNYWHCFAGCGEGSVIAFWMQ